MNTLRDLADRATPPPRADKHPCECLESFGQPEGPGSQTVTIPGNKHLLATGKEDCIIHRIRFYFVISYVIFIFADLKPDKTNYENIKVYQF